MRGGKMNEVMRRNLSTLLEVIKSPLPAHRYYNSYKVGYWFREENEADNFRKLLLFNIGFSRNRVETLKTYHKPGYIIYITWRESEQEDLIENIERYLQEDNMGPTNINEENTKFYAIVTDAEGKQTAYEIQHPSLETRWECSFGESNITHTVEFDQDYMKKCDCVFTEWVKQKDELEKLRAENELLRKDMKDVSERLDKCEGENVGLSRRLVRCENQLRSACEFLNGYGDVHIDIPTEIKNLDYFSSIVNYTVNGETKRREFGKKVAEQVKRLAGWYGAWREPVNAESMVEDNKILDDAVESAINPFYISSDYIKVQPYYMQNHKYDSSFLRELQRKTLQLNMNSIYGLTAASIEKINKTKGIITPIFDAYESIKDVKFANPATIVFWKDGTKTVVKAQGDEQYVPEVGLAMCICKKVMGNTRDYYRVFKHWMKKV